MSDVVLETKPLPTLSWVAVYDEDDYLHQFIDGRENGYGEIDRDRLKEFHIIETTTSRHVFAMALEPGQRLIFRRRVSMSAVSGDKNWEILLVGWQETVGDRNVQCLNWVFPDGSIIQTGKFTEDHNLFYGVELLGFEK